MIVTSQNIFKKKRRKEEKKKRREEEHIKVVRNIENEIFQYFVEGEQEKS